jgi:hypothetical protein
MIEIKSYPITLDGAIGKCDLKIQSNRLMSYAYEQLGRKFCCEYIMDNKIKQWIEENDSVKQVATSSSSLFMF